MKSTHNLVKDLRSSMPLGEIVKELVSEAANRIEELERANKNTLADLALAVAERTPHDYELLKQEARYAREAEHKAKEQRDEALAEVSRVTKCCVQGDLMLQKVKAEREEALANLHKRLEEISILRWGESGDTQPTTVDQINELRELNQELRTELNYALAELHQARGNARPEPSRLEMAAMCLQGMVSSGSWGQSAAVVALEYTDKLIEAAKEAK